MTKDFFDSTNLEGAFPQIEQKIRLGSPTAVFGVSEGDKYLTAAISEGPFLYITADFISARRACEAIASLSGQDVALLTAKDEVLTFKRAVSKDALFKRICCLDKILSGNKRVVLDIEAAIQLLPKRLPIIEINTGEDLDYESVPKKLLSMGYIREYTPEVEGTFTIRGDVLDIFPVGAENPVRVDFFGDNIEKIRPYDITSGERLSDIKSIRILPATDCFIEKSEIPFICDRINKSIKKFPDAFSYDRARQICDNFPEDAKAGTFDGASFYLPLVQNCTTIFSLMPKGTIVYLDESKNIDDKLEALLKEHADRFDSLFKGGECFDFSFKQLLSKDEFLKELDGFLEIGLQSFLSNTAFFRPVDMVKMHSTPAPSYFNQEDQLMEDIKSWLQNGYRIIMYTDGINRMERLQDALLDEGFPVVYLPDNLEVFRGIALQSGALCKGTVLHESKLVILGSGDLYIKSSSQSKRIRHKRGDVFVAPEVGDYVVHERHGIGRIIGTKKLETVDGIKEYIACEYSGGDILYVPVEQMDLLSKYNGDSSPELSRIGGQEFSKVKERVRKSIRKLAFDLKALYAERAKKKGFHFPENEVMMEEFEDEFPYEETPDQLDSIAEIKADMCSDKVMDRLLCGDVGFGKTEVALRAVYLCVLGGKQAALMCPSTVLCDQHYNVACKRFEEFGVRVAKLNRFCSSKDISKTLNDLKNGHIDFVIGTHRLLSKDVKFYDLGLLILDEEQRFGVEHKEKLKNLKSDVDCLTLSATPIPRTLHMSLSGIRDISTINTPPQKRLPIQTYVVEETEVLIRDACVREISRGGQVFILYNRVESIATFANRIQEIVPEGKVVYIHGQMDKTNLETGVEKFYLGECNILVTTTIIENGIDLPNANTIIIIDADRFGASQLYQLRGRVGRSSRLAYAYLTYKTSKVMTADAVERLKAIMQFTELGSGYKVAMRDLEIRGAGNVLGAEQSGHMDKVGYELYSKMLKEELTGEESVTAELDIKTSAYISQNYIESPAARMDCYKQIAEIRTVADYKRICTSLEETYGEMPEEVLNLLIIAVLKSYACKFNVTKIAVSQSNAQITFSSLASLKDGKINAAIEKFKTFASLNMAKEAQVRFVPLKTPAKTMVQMTKFLKYAVSFGKEL